MNGSLVQYGALGVLAIVLLGVGAGLRAYLKYTQDRNAQFDKWLRELIEADRIERRETTQRLDALLASTLEVQTNTVTAMTELSSQYKKQQTESTERHKEIMRTLRGGANA